MTAPRPLPPPVAAKLRRLERDALDAADRVAAAVRRHWDAREDYQKAVLAMDNLALSYAAARAYVGISYSTWIGNGPRDSAGKAEPAPPMSQHPQVETIRRRIADTAAERQRAEAEALAIGRTVAPAREVYRRCLEHLVKARFDTAGYQLP